MNAPDGAAEGGVAFFFFPTRFLVGDRFFAAERARTAAPLLVSSACLVGGDFLVELRLPSQGSLATDPGDTSSKRDKPAAGGRRASGARDAEERTDDFGGDLEPCPFATLVLFL